MAIILDEENKVVTVENQPDAPRALFKNLPEASTIEGGVGDVLINDRSIVDENGDADIPVAGVNVLGVIKTIANRGLYAWSDGRIEIDPASASQIKAGTDSYRPIAPATQKNATFYGMAAAAGDTTQAASDNAPGNYTDEAKIAIRRMLGLPSHIEAELINDYTVEQDTNSVVISTDFSGNTFRLRKAHAIVLFPQSTTGTNSNVYVRCTDSDTGEYFYFGGQVINGNSSCVITYEYESHGKYFDIGSFKTPSLGESSSSIAKIAYNAESKSINAIYIQRYSEGYTLIPVGTRIILYGMRE